MVRTAKSAPYLGNVGLNYQFETVTLAGFSRTSVDPLVCGGRPVVTGTRVPVKDVLEMLAGGATPAEIASDFPYLSENDVRAVLTYAAASTLNEG